GYRKRVCATRADGIFLLSSSHWPLSWRKVDSNLRSPVRESTLFETAGFERWQIIRPADEHHARLDAGPCSRGTDGSQTPRWREMDSNYRSPVRWAGDSGRRAPAPLRRGSDRMTD